MTPTRREVIKGSAAIAVRSALYSGGVGAAVSLTSCGGGTTTTPPPVSAPSGLSYTSGPLTVGTAITLTPTVTGSVTSYSVSPPLPAGLTLNTTTGVISGTPSTAAAQSTYTVTATNAGGSTSFGLVLLVKAQLAILSTSNSTPTALTPVTLSMAGFDPTQAFSVTLQNSTGFQLTAPIVRAATDGSAIVIAAPMFLDPATGMTSGLTVFATVTQGSVTSNAVTLTISDLPSVASLGVGPGEISRAFFNQLALGFAVSVNGLQAMAARPTAKTDTSTVRANILKQQLASLEARDNVDVIVSGAQPSLSVGTSHTGASIQFDANSVDALDRVLAMYLQHLGVLPSTIYPPPSANSSAMHQTTRSRRRRSARVKRVPALHITHAPSTYTLQAAGLTVKHHVDVKALDVKTIIDSMGTLGGALGVVNSWIQVHGTPTGGNATTQEKVDECISIGQGVSSLALAVGGVLTLAGATTVAPVVVGAAVLTGTLYGLAAIANDGYKMYTYSQAIDDATIAGDPTKLAAAQQQLQSAKDNFALDVIGTGLGVLGFPSEAVEGSVAKDVVDYLATSQSGAQGVVVQGLGLLQNGVSILVSLNGAPTQGDADGQAVSNSNAELPTGAGSFGLVDGSLSIANAANPMLVPLGGVALIDPATNATFETSAGTDNNYELVVPLDVPGIDYPAMQLEPYDPIGNIALASPTLVDLSALAAGTPIDEGTLTGTCNDTDASAPDQDDPDCD